MRVGEMAHEPQWALKVINVEPQLGDGFVLSNGNALQWLFVGLFRMFQSKRLQGRPERILSSLN